MEATKKSINKPHVLVLPYPAQGHINPMLQFSKRLVCRGIKATLAITVYLSKSMLADPTSQIAIDTISDGFDDGGSDAAESSEAYLAKFRIVGAQTLAHLIDKLNNSGHRVNAVVYDAFLPWALDVSKQFGVARAAFFTQSCAVNNIYYHVHQGFLSLPLSGSTVSVPGLPPLEPQETPSFIHIPGSYPGFYKTVIDQFSNIDEADWVLFNTFHKLEEEVVDWLTKLWRVRTVGPTLPSMYLDKQLKDDKDYGVNLFKPNSTACMKWLSGKPSGSIIYVSFGSGADLEPEQMHEIAWSLKNVDYNFLWVVRATEESKLPNNFIDEISEKGLIVKWSPQLEVLAHESTGCFVTHCGFNSVLESIGLGVPMVGMPQWTDQCTNAKYVEDVWCTGLRAKTDEKGIVRREVLQSCIREVMEGERGKEIKKNTIKWKNLAKEATDEGGSSDKNIDEFVAELMRFY